MATATFNILALVLGALLCVWFVRSRVTQGRKMKARMFADRYGTCRSCGSPPAGHSTWLLAMAVVSREPNRLAELERLVTEGKWVEANAIQEFEGLEDEIQFLVLRCPVTGELSLKKIVTPSELWANDTVLQDISLSAEDQERLAAMAGDAWTVL